MTPEEMKGAVREISRAVQDVDDEKARQFADPAQALQMIGVADTILNRAIKYADPNDPRTAKMSAWQRALSDVRDTISTHLIG